MKIQQAGATVLFEQNREWLLSTGLRSIGLAEVCGQQYVFLEVLGSSWLIVIRCSLAAILLFTEDGRGPYEMVKARLVMADFEVKNILVDIAATNGKKTALDKSHMLAASLQKLANGDEKVLNVFKCKTQASRFQCIALQHKWPQISIRSKIVDISSIIGILTSYLDDPAAPLSTIAFLSYFLGGRFEESSISSCLRSI